MVNERSYEGSFVVGVEFGRGKVAEPDGTVCDGYFRGNDLCDGKVKVTKNDGTIYYGNSKKGEMAWDFVFPPGSDMGVSVSN